MGYFEVNQILGERLNEVKYQYDDNFESLKHKIAENQYKVF